MKKLYEDVLNKQELIAYTTRQKALFDYNTLMEENYRRGFEERALNIAERMRADGIDEEIIRKYCDI